ncbi:hypothetical protein [Acaryochloris sp. IP29b_bin.148]|uniref:hypothetical protein n=1 Tax=Acaryochloris sp. IP29b_bin.148 TaxID=2969218 RepID=UPI00262BF052|nr:hypothetical protein [Acaryochloris sp. IP29b_bin.148]
MTDHYVQRRHILAVKTLLVTFTEVKVLRKREIAFYVNPGKLSLGMVLGLPVFILPANVLKHSQSSPLSQ